MVNANCIAHNQWKESTEWFLLEEAKFLKETNQFFILLILKKKKFLFNCFCSILFNGNVRSQLMVQQFIA